MGLAIIADEHVVLLEGNGRSIGNVELGTRGSGDADGHLVVTSSVGQQFVVDLTGGIQ